MQGKSSLLQLRLAHRVIAAELVRSGKYVAAGFGGLAPSAAEGAGIHAFSYRPVITPKAGI
ncbi:MAG: hypothetical protein NTX52_03785 [Planctomycetota bacterium]|nr:hypothetical protein [Planctomycetota bacterium]